MKIHFDSVKDTILDIKKDPRSEVFNFGEDNAYPSLIEALIESSVTAKACVDKVSKAVYGKSFGENGKKIVNKKGQSLNELLRIAARQMSRHKNLFIHVGYDGGLKIKSIEVLSSKDVRVGKDDDRGYSGKFIVYDNWDKVKGKTIQSNKFKVVDRFNLNERVITAQVAAVGEIKKYRGQIIHIQSDSGETYSVSDLQPVLSECLLEANSQIFRSRGSEKGFLNTKLMVVKPFATDDDRRMFRNKLNKLQGAENSGGVLLLESSNISDELDKEVMLEDLSNDYNDTLFEYSDLQARKNIALAMGVPLGLIDVNDSSLFGNSGELIKEMKKTLWEEQEETRDQLEEVFNTLATNFNEPIEELKIINPYQNTQQ